MLERTIRFGDGICVSGTVLDNVCKSVFETIKKELPEELQIHSVINEVLNMCKEKAAEKRVIL